MELNQATPSCVKVFTFTEELEEEPPLQAHSYGNGRFIQGIPNEDCEVSFSLYKADENSLDIQIYDDDLFKFLRTIPDLRDELDRSRLSISMNVLLPCYSEVRERLAQYEREGDNLDALELFVRHFLRDGSVFAIFGFEHLHENGILTELHFHDIQSQFRSISEDLDLLDEAIDKLEAEDIEGPSPILMKEPSQSQLRTSIALRDPIAVGKVLAIDSGIVDAKSLCLAMHAYEPTVFRLLLVHGAQVDGSIDEDAPLYLAAENGNMDAVQLLLSFGADKEGKCLWDHPTPLTVAASAGHLEIVKYLVEEKDAKIEGSGNKSPLSGALKHHRIDVVNYLRRAGGYVFDNEILRPVFHAFLRGIDARSHQKSRSAPVGNWQKLAEAASDGNVDAVQGLINDGAEVNPKSGRLPLYLAASNGHLEVVRLLVGAGADVNPKIPGGRLPLNLAASNGHLEVVCCLVEAGANVNPTSCTTPLYDAALTGHLEVVCYLVKAGANVNAMCSGPLYVAAKCGHLEVVCYLVKAGANVNPMGSGLPLYVAAKCGHLEVVRCLVEAGADVNPMGRGLPLCVAAECGHLEVVRLLVRAGAYVNPSKLWYLIERSPLAEAVMRQHAGVTHFLSSAGATLLQGEYQLLTNLKRKNLYQIIGTCNQSLKGIQYEKRPKTLVTIGQFLQEVKDSGCFEDEEACPAIAAVRAQERRITERILFAKVASSCERLLDAGASQDASASLREFVDQVGTSSSVFKSGTRAIRDISEGYMPPGLRYIVGALQVADAMRSVVPPSKLVYSKQEFLDDIPRWASLLSPDDQRLFDEIAPHLWGVPGSKSTQEGATRFAWDETLMFLQALVNNLVNASVSSGASCDTRRLQSLRQKHLSARSHTSEIRLHLTKWCPPPTPEVQRSLHGHEPKPPDQNGETSTLARITVLMAGAIFGVILLYLCLSQCGFSIPSLLLLASKTVKDWLLSHIVARNCIVLAMYIRSTSIVESVSWKSNANVLPNPTQTSPVLPGTPTIDKVQEHIVADQSSYDGDFTMIDFPSMVDYTMEGGRPDCSPSFSSILMAPPSVTTISPSAMTTETPGSTATGTSDDGTIQCQHCESKFQLGKNGRRGRASNLRKHMRSHHPDTLPSYQRVLHECRWGCGAKDPYKSNIEAHEKKYCAKTKGKQPRRHGKWRDATTGTV